jgi:hypothetical protein
MHEILSYPRDVLRFFRFLLRILLFIERLVQHQFRKIVWLLLIVTVVMLASRAFPYVSQALSAGALIAGLLLQLAFGLAFGIIQFAGLMWFLARPRMYWIMPEGGNETGLSFNDYRGNPELVRSLPRSCSRRPRATAAR